MSSEPATSEKDLAHPVKLPDSAPSTNAHNSRDGPDVSDNSSPSVKLEKAIREVVREELGRPATPTSSATKPTLADAFWWLLCVVDVGLLIWWIPENLFENKKLDFYIKSVAWVGSYLFLLGYAWFKNQFLVFSRQRPFKVVILALLLVLVPFYFSLLPIFQIYPFVEPENAELIVDGDTAAKRSPKDLRLSLGRHDITVIQKISDDEKPNTRDFKLGYIDFFRTWWRRDYRPHWPLLYAVPITTNEAGVEVVIRKTDGDFDPDFISQKRHTTFNAPVEFMNGGPILSFYGPELGVDSIVLPYGTYEVFARKKDCGQTQPQSISSFDASDGVVIEALCKEVRPKSE